MVIHAHYSTIIKMPAHENMNPNYVFHEFEALVCYENEVLYYPL